MNILLIGNGFDLAHRLPTKYMDFLEFCEQSSKIYTYIFKKGDLLKEYEKALEGSELNDDIKCYLIKAFNSRKKSDEKITTDFNSLDDIYNLICSNIWYKYFMSKRESLKIVKENWIDFEKEISLMIQRLDNQHNGRKVDCSPEEMQKFYDCDRDLIKNYCDDSIKYSRFLSDLEVALREFIRAFEIYLCEIVEKLSVDQLFGIDSLGITHVLSFNYTGTFERIYDNDKKRKYCYIHGNVNIEHDIETNNMVLGIDEYLIDNKDKDLDYVAFKKYFQRIVKSNDVSYFEWLETIEQSLSSVQDLRGKSNLHIIGHSLDETDKDILAKLICNDKIYTKIYYYEENVNDKRDLASKVKNLIKIIGQDELIKRTGGGSSKTIEFVPLALIMC